MVKALFPIGKTQWIKWDDVQRGVFNLLREGGTPYEEAIKEANCSGWVLWTPVTAPQPVETETVKTVKPVKKAAPKQKAK